MRDAFSVVDASGVDRIVSAAVMLSYALAILVAAIVVYGRRPWVVTGYAAGAFVMSIAAVISYSPVFTDAAHSQQFSVLATTATVLSLVTVVASFGVLVVASKPLSFAMLMIGFICMMHSIDDQNVAVGAAQPSVFLMPPVVLVILAFTIVVVRYEKCFYRREQRLELQGLSSISKRPAKVARHALPPSPRWWRSGRDFHTGHGDTSE